MIKELSELGKKLRSSESHNALKDEPFSIDLLIGEDGSFQDFFLFEKQMAKRVEAITAKKGKARLLLDKAEEILQYGGEASKKKHQLFLEKLNEYSNLKSIQPVLAFYNRNKEKGVELALSLFESKIPEKERKGNIAFRLHNMDSRIHDNLEVQESIIQKYEEAQKSKLATIAKTCSICGKNEYPVEDIPHGMIKRVPEGTTSGCALVSFNNDAFESYGLEGNQNSSICTNCAKTYVEGLGWLMNDGSPTLNEKGKEYYKFNHRKNFGPDTAMVFWTKENQKVEEIDFLEQPDEQAVSSLIESVASGSKNQSRYIQTDQFYSCTLSGVSARIAVRDWIETSLENLRNQIAKWFQDIKISHYDSALKQTKILYPRLYDLARTGQNMDETKHYTLSRTAVHLWNCALKNSAPPLWVLTSVLKRIRLEGVTFQRASIIRLILNRNFKGGIMINEQLDPANENPAYVAGQIFAKIESIQYAALGDRNSGIREKYFSYAMTAPLAAFGRLFNLNAKHFTKLKSDKPGLAVNLDKELQALVGKIEIAKLSATFSLEQQGQFAIGYYHQKERQFNKSESKETIKEN
ncbi:MAG: type I-C CRISPR-associated protein Cas8c/Csd1 [Candidatus Aureabacteria bacterium]|nr:type I-C CRISPR-associated protein Cas8c/Csd1 [Candidatus Auribacterota bacterium]